MSTKESKKKAEGTNSATLSPFPLSSLTFTGVPIAVSHVIESSASTFGRAISGETPIRYWGLFMKVAQVWFPPAERSDHLPATCSKQA